MKIINFFLSLLVSSIGAFAQRGTITEKITTSDNQPTPYISVGLKDKSFGATTNNQGVKIKPGTYTIKVSAIDPSSAEKTVTIMGGKNIVDFSLQGNQEMRNEITVDDRKKSYKINKPFAFLRLNELTLEVPQNIQIAGKQTFKDQQIISMSDGLIRNVNGAVRLALGRYVYQY